MVWYGSFWKDTITISGTSYRYPTLIRMHIHSEHSHLVIFNMVMLSFIHLTIFWIAINTKSFELPYLKFIWKGVNDYAVFLFLCDHMIINLKNNITSSSQKWYIKWDLLCLFFHLTYDHRADGSCSGLLCWCCLLLAKL